MKTRIPLLTLLLTLSLTTQGFAIDAPPAAVPAPANPAPPAAPAKPTPPKLIPWPKLNPKTAIPTSALLANYLSREEGIARGQFPDAPPAFWLWLAQNPNVRMGLFLSGHPVQIQYVKNFAYLWNKLGALQSHKYSSFLLASALSSPNPIYEGAKPIPLEMTDIEKKMAQGVQLASTRTPEPMVFFLHHQGEFLGHDTPDSEQLKLINFDNLALYTKVFPDRGQISAGDNAIKVVKRLETFVKEADGLKWPLFPVAQAPYYLLHPLTQGLPAREQDYMWERFIHPKNAAQNGEKLDGYHSGSEAVNAAANAPVAAAVAAVPAPKANAKKGPPNITDSLALAVAKVSVDCSADHKGRLMDYGTYGWDYTAQEIRFKKSDWHPDSWPRILADGGVCGRMAQLASFNRNTLGIPSTTAGQPGHCAFMMVTYESKTQAKGQEEKKQYVAAVGHAINTWDVTVPFVPVGITPAITGFEKCSASWLAMTETANHVSEANYFESLLYMQLAQENPSLQDKVDLLKISVNLNPYNLGAWSKLLEASSTFGPKTFNVVLMSMVNHLAFPDGMAEVKDKAKSKAKNGQDAKIDASKINDILKGTTAQNAKQAEMYAQNDLSKTQEQKDADALQAQINKWGAPRNKIGDQIMQIAIAYVAPSNYDTMLAKLKPSELVGGVEDMAQVMQACDEAGITDDSGNMDRVFEKYIAQVSTKEATELFNSSFEKALLSDAKGDGSLLVMARSFKDVGQKLTPNERVQMLKGICEKIAAVIPRYKIGKLNMLVYGKSFDMMAVFKNAAYQAALEQLVQALRDAGNNTLADGTQAQYTQEEQTLKQKADAMNLADKVLQQAIERQKKQLLEDDKKRV